MKHSTKLLLNTIASYGRIIVNTIVTLISTRLALKYLGADDFGLYNLIAGVVLMLSFFNGSLMISSQRYFSIAIGEGNKSKLNQYFNASLGIHIVISGVIGVALVAMMPFLFNGFLKIPEGRENVAIVVYLVMVFSAISTVATIPFSAIMNAREDLVVLSLIDIVYCFGKLVAAVALLFVTQHLLVTYSVIMLMAVVFKMLLEIVWSVRKYAEAKLQKHFLFDRNISREMLGFVGWNTLGSVAVIVRNQGVAIALNVFFGTVVNAAYGIAHQVNALVLSFASTLTTVFTPMIIQAKGAGNDKKMLESAILSSKLSFLLSSMMSLPILMFMKELLELWLSDFPKYTESFCVLTVYSFLIQQLYPGVNRAVYATGKIKGYQISLSIFLISIIPIGTSLFYLGFPPISIMVVMIVSQVLTLLSTVFFAWKYCNLDISEFLLKSISLPVALFLLAITLSGWIRQSLPSTISPSLMILVSGILALLFSLCYFFIVLNRPERKSLISIVANLRNHK